MNANRNTTRMLATMIALAAMTGVATTAQAAGALRYADVVVSYSDLNLDSAAGNQKLYARLAHAASRACGGEPAARDVKLNTQYRECVETTLDRAVGKVRANDPRALRSVAREQQAG